MYEPNPLFAEPGDAAIVWRYMPFVAFVDLLQRRKLLFTRLEGLEDPQEGTYNDRIRAAVGLNDRQAALRENFTRRNYCVNCWHENSGESAAMWTIYANHHGIAIQTTASKLRRAFAGEARKLSIARVSYESALKPNAAPVAIKRKSFEHEKEVRAWLLEADRANDQKFGTYVSVDLDALIESVFVSPTAKKWIVPVVQGTLDRHCIQVRAVQSDLYSTSLV